MSVRLWAAKAFGVAELWSRCVSTSSKEDAASSILREAGGVDVNDRRSEYEAGGLTGYDEGADLWNAEVSGRPIVPPTPR